MVSTRIQVEYFSREQLIKELVKFCDIADWLKRLTEKFDNVSKKYEEFKSDFDVNKKCKSFLYCCTVQLEAVNKAQYHRRKILELNPVSQGIYDNL